MIIFELSNLHIFFELFLSTIVITLLYVVFQLDPKQKKHLLQIVLLAIINTLIQYLKLGQHVEVMVFAPILIVVFHFWNHISIKRVLMVAIAYIFGLFIYQYILSSIYSSDTLFDFIGKINQLYPLFVLMKYAVVSIMIYLFLLVSKEESLSMSKAIIGIAIITYFIGLLFSGMAFRLRVEIVTRDEMLIGLRTIMFMYIPVVFLNIFSLFSIYVLNRYERRQIDLYLEKKNIEELSEEMFRKNHNLVNMVLMVDHYLKEKQYEAIKEYLEK